MPPRYGAVQALRELLEGRGAALESGLAGVAAPLPVPPAEEGAPEPPAGQHPGMHDSLATQAAAAEPAPPVAAQAVAPPSPPPQQEASGGSVPPTARLLIDLGGGIGREEAAGERQHRAAELRVADAAVREAEVQRAQLDALLLRQRAAEAERERHRAERDAQLAALEAALARQHMAARQIVRAWRRFLASPGRRREVAAATCIQAAWRGCASRRRTAAELACRRERRSLLAHLNLCVAAGELAAAQAAAARLAELGAGPQVAQLVAGLEQLAAEAERVLHTAAASSGAEAYGAAAAEAERYAHLAAARREAAHRFAARVAAVEEAVTQAVDGGPLLRFKEAVAAAAALGVGAPFLARAEQRFAERNQHAAQALQAALDAAPFSPRVFAESLERARCCGLHADVARAQRGLQLRKHRAATAAQQTAVEGSAAAVEAACQEAAHLGLAREADAAQARLGQRQAAALEGLRQAAHAGCLQQYEAAAAVAVALKLDVAEQQACRERLQQRQQEAGQALQAAAALSDVPAVRRHCQAALLLGLAPAVDAARQEVHRRRQAAAGQLAASARAACEFVSHAAHVAQERGEAELSSLCATPRSTPWQQLLAGWLAGAAQLAAAAAERGMPAALMHPPAACAAWPAELRGWLGEAQQAVRLECEQAALTAIHTVQAHLEALSAELQLVGLPLKPPQVGGSGRPTSSGRRSTSGALLSARHRLASSAGTAQQVQLEGVPSCAATGEQRLLTCYQEWRDAQQDMLPLVAGVAERAAAGEDGGEEEEEEGGGVGGVLDVSCQGLDSLQLRAGGVPAALDLSTNALTSLEGLSTLHSLRALRCSCNPLASLTGVEALGGLTTLEAAGCGLERLPSLAALPSLRHLDLSSNRLTAGALAAAGLPAGACPQLTSLRLADNRQLSQGWLGTGWLGPQPCLLHLDVSGCELESLEGLAAAAPLLQVLVASDNRLDALPPALHLPFLRQLWLGGNRLAGVPAWPWLPSLRELQLQDNQLELLAPVQGLASLHTLDLSFNRLASLRQALASLAPLAGTLEQLRLNDNPLAQPWGQQAQQQAQQGRLGGGGGGGGGGRDGSARQPYPTAVFAALPQLRELDSQEVGADGLQRHQQAAAARRAPAALPPAGAGWDASTLLWVLSQPGAAAEAQRAHQQQQQADMAALLALHGEVAPAVRPAVAGLAAALTGLQLAAGLEQPSSAAKPSTQPACSGGWPKRGGTREQRRVLLQAQHRYLLLASGQLPAAQGMLLLNPLHYQHLLARLQSAATRIQSAWRRRSACVLRARLARERAAALQAAAAACIQAACRGWACRHRSHAWVQHKLVIWRRGWQEAQVQLLEHQRGWAAVRIQAAWRGAFVRTLLARARQELQARRAACGGGAGSGGGEASSLDLELSNDWLEGFLDGGSSALLAAPEVLQPQLAAAAGLGGGQLPACGTLQPAQLGGSKVSAQPAGGSQAQLWQHLLPLPPVAGAWGPGSAATAGARSSSAGGVRSPGPLQPLPQAAAPAGPAPTAGACAAGWEFSDAATAAAYETLRKKHAAAAARRERQQLMRDPVQRLHHLFARGGGGGMGGTLPSKPSSDGKLHGSSGSVSTADWSLPALPTGWSTTRGPPTRSGSVGGVPVDGSGGSGRPPPRSLHRAGAATQPSRP